MVNQSFKNIEYIVIDNNSNDNSCKVISNWNNKNNKILKLIFNDKNLGISKAFNEGLTHATGDYIIDLAADDVLTPEAIEKHLSNFKNNNYQVGVSFGNVENIDSNNHHISYHYPIKNDKKAISKPKDGNVYIDVLKHYFISSPSLMSHIDVYKKLRGYDPSLYFEDFDYLLRSSRLFPYFYCDEIVIRKRELKNSMSKSLTKVNIGSYLHRKSFYKIYLKAMQMNANKAENNALLKRISQELKICAKCLFLNLLFLNSLLFIKCFIKTLNNKQ